MAVETADVDFNSFRFITNKEDEEIMTRKKKVNENTCYAVLSGRLCCARETIKHTQISKMIHIRLQFFIP